MTSEVKIWSGKPGKGALSGLKVIEIGNNIAVAYCCKLMADLGAEVIKAEDPKTADLDRQEGSIWSSEHDGADGRCLFAYVNSNKLGISLNLESKSGQSVLDDLVREADVLVEGNSPQRAKELGLGYDRLSQVNKMLVVTSITPFGQTGPWREYKAYDITISAAGYASKKTGESGREPLFIPLSQTHFQGGLMATTTTLAAIFAREVIGRGQHIDISEAEVWLTHHGGGTINAFIRRGMQVQRAGRFQLRLFPNGIMDCDNGEVFFGCNTGHQWKLFLEMVGEGKIPEWYAKEPKYNIFFQELYYKYGEEIRAGLQPFLSSKTKQELFELALEKRVPLAPVNTFSELIEDPHLNERKYFVEADDPELGKVKFPGPPYRFAKTPWSMERPAPTLGQHNDEVYRNRLGYSKERLSQLRREGVI